MQTEEKELPRLWIVAPTLLFNPNRQDSLNPLIPGFKSTELNEEELWFKESEVMQKENDFFCWFVAF